MNSIRVFFMFKRARHTHTLRLEPTRNNIKHAVGLRSAALFALRNGSTRPYVDSIVDPPPWRISSGMPSLRP